MSVRSWLYQTRHRLDNRLQDALAVAAGACNADTWNGHTYYGGYSHWRCAREREHIGAHRFNNYKWRQGERPQYDPLPVETKTVAGGAAAALLPYRALADGRHMITTRRRAKQQQAYYERAREMREAAR